VALGLALGTKYDALAQEAGSATVITLHGKIVGVHKAVTKWHAGGPAGDWLIVLEGPGGKEVTVHSGNHPGSFGGLRVGTPVVVRYYEVVSMRPKPPGQEGYQKAASISGGIAGAASGNRKELLVTVDAIDADNSTVTVKAADGTVETVKPYSHNQLDRLKVGDEVVAGVWRAVLVSLEGESGSGAS